MNSVGRGMTMKGVWFWPSDPKEQEKVLRDVQASESILAALTALSKSKDGLSNAQLDIAIASFSQWYTRWTIDQLLSLGFVEYKVEWFGDAGKYVLTDLGKDVLRRLMGQPPPSPPPQPLSQPPPQQQQPAPSTPVPVPKPAG